MSAVALIVRRTADGWSVCFTTGQQLVEYRGPFARRRAVRYLQEYARTGDG
jgi:hypothetical protein